ncbi:hypothetical protein RhiirA1_485330 [Rhizophagus irregularis]|uniref:Uncharacterized protein n=1 Tax=Rhizophagus irregularis TaxID=588596 RepID=A0A2I1FR15_9GLOM|nr:hypothetical protein RhiirA1_485330 [Rhizophagus irregularis]PKY36804.1 hypothetical protein RhiirB3_460301 [Rhizophagus irregularis]CAB4469251.1 unnamed protein product [Rhizophagus irregularis]CAB5393125.1 unnamed protein product [Rhizophagus irregularis]
MATAIKALPTESTKELKEFWQKCIQFYNNRWKQFDHELYLLAYFLNPKFCGKGFIPETYQLIQRKALALWSKMGRRSKLAFTLAVQMNNYDDSYIDELPTQSLFARIGFIYSFYCSS